MFPCHCQVPSCFHVDRNSIYFRLTCLITSPIPWKFLILYRTAIGDFFGFFSVSSRFSLFVTFSVSSEVYTRIVRSSCQHMSSVFFVYSQLLLSICANFYTQAIYMLLQSCMSAYLSFVTVSNWSNRSRWLLKQTLPTAVKKGCGPPKM